MHLAAIVPNTSWNPALTTPNEPAPRNPSSSTTHLMSLQSNNGTFTKFSNF